MRASPALPRDVIVALESADPHALAKVVARHLSKDPEGKAYDQIVPLILAGFHAPPATDMMDRITRFPSPASPQQAQAWCEALWPVVWSAASLTRESAQGRLWEGFSNWALAQPTPAKQASAGRLLASLWQTSLPHLSRTQSHEALDALLAMRSTVSEPLLDALLTPEALDDMARHKVGLKPSDLVLVQSPFDASTAEANQVLAQRQAARLEAVLAHPSAAQLLRLDLRPTKPFQALLAGAGQTPARATQVAKALLPLYRAHKPAHAQLLDDLLVVPSFERLATTGDPGTVAEFWASYPAFVPPKGWKSACQDLVHGQARRAWQAVVQEGIPPARRQDILEKVTQTLDALFQHVPASHRDDWHAALRGVRNDWHERSLNTSAWGETIQDISTLDDAQRAELRAQIELVFINPVLDYLDAKPEVNRRDNGPLLGALLIRLSRAPSPAPRSRGPR